RVGILTGAGDVSFSAGMDLKERLHALTSHSRTQHYKALSYPSSGFGGLTRRTGRKPVLAAVNGHAHGGGFELVLNADLAILSWNATLRLPDVTRGTAATQGAFPRLVRALGMQRASLVALTGQAVTATQALDWGLCVKVADSEGSQGVVEEAIEMAKLIARMSPDSVIVSRAGLREAWETGSVERATQKVEERWNERLMGGENAKEGMRAFAEKRTPVWRASKL
ncbi:MAG: hypothetical protein Q9162_007612, partial [Coniocarpon cinnabarinum]